MRWLPVCSFLVRRLLRSSGAAPLSLSLAAALTLPACHQAPELPNPLPIESAAYDPAYEASIDVLREAGFRIAQRDYRFGTVSTHPKGSPTLVEFWVGDNTTLRQGVGSTLSDIRRSVRIELEPRQGGEAGEAAETDPGNGATGRAIEGYTLRVEVSEQRQQVPVRRMTGSVRTGVFSELREVPEEWSRRSIARSYWEPIGRDPQLEQRLLRRIAERASALGEVEEAS